MDDDRLFIVHAIRSTLTCSLATECNRFSQSNSKSASGGIMFKKNTGRVWDARSCIRSGFDDSKTVIIQYRDKKSAILCDTDAKSSLLIKRHLAIHFCYVGLK